MHTFYVKYSNIYLLPLASSSSHCTIANSKTLRLQINRSFIAIFLKVRVTNSAIQIIQCIRSGTDYLHACTEQDRFKDIFFGCFVSYYPNQVKQKENLLLHNNYTYLSKF